MAGLYYEEFEVEQTIEHARRRTVSERDNQMFCDMTMNQQPLYSTPSSLVTLSTASASSRTLHDESCSWTDNPRND